MYSLRTGATHEAEKFVEENISKIGKVKSIHHKRNSTKVDYETIIKGEYETIVVQGGITSGYNGSGPKGLYRVFKLLGVDEETAQQSAFGDADKENHEFNIQF